MPNISPVKKPIFSRGTTVLRRSYVDSRHFLGPSALIVTISVPVASLSNFTWRAFDHYPMPMNILPLRPLRYVSLSLIYGAIWGDLSNLYVSTI